MKLEQFKKATREEAREYGETIPFGTTYDKNGKLLTYRDDSYGFWTEWTYDEDGNNLTYKYSVGYWCEWTYDKLGNELTERDSHGVCRIKGKEVSEEEYIKFVKENNKMTIEQFKKLNRKEIDEYGETLSGGPTYDKKGMLLTLRDITNNGDWEESTYDKNGHRLTFKDNTGYWNEHTYVKNKWLFKDSEGYYQINAENVSEKEYNKFIKENNDK